MVEMDVLIDTVACHTDICGLINNSANNKKVRRKSQRGHKDVIIELSPGCLRLWLVSQRTYEFSFCSYMGDYCVVNSQEISRFLEKIIQLKPVYFVNVK